MEVSDQDKSLKLWGLYFLCFPEHNTQLCVHTWIYFYLYLTSSVDMIPEIMCDAWLFQLLSYDLNWPQWCVSFYWILPFWFPFLAPTSLNYPLLMGCIDHTGVPRLLVLMLWFMLSCNLQKRANLLSLILNLAILILPFLFFFSSLVLVLPFVSLKQSDNP